MPEILPPRFGKFAPPNVGSQPRSAPIPGVRGFFRSDQKHLRHLRHLRSHAVRELTAILARGFLRLTEKQRNYELSLGREPQILLDVVRPESPHVRGDQDHRGQEHAR